MLLSLPPEVLAIIFDNVVHCVGIRLSVRSRLVCHNFDGYILDAIYALPTFEDLDDDSPDHLTSDMKMSKFMVIGLIRTKLRSHQQERALTRQILSTSSFITKTLANANKEIYTDTLVYLAADSLPLHEIIKGLSRDPIRLETSPYLLENAFAAALSLDQTSHIQDLVNLGAKAQYRTKWFGDAFLIAARHAAKNTFWSLLRTAQATDDPVKKRLATARLIMALEYAATHGRAEIFCADLWPFIDQRYDQRLLPRVFEPAIKSAMLAGHESVVLAIFDLFKSHSKDHLKASQDIFWVEILRLAASNGFESIVQLVLSNTAVCNINSSLDLPLEDACRNGRTTSVKLLIAHHTEHNLGSYAGSFYWAARRTHYDILRLLVQSLEQTDASYLGDVLCGASIHTTSEMAAVFKITAEPAYVQRDLDLEGKTFAQIIDIMFEAGVFNNSIPNKGLVESRRGSSEWPEDEIFQELLSEEHLQLAQACREGKLWAVCDIIARFGDENTAASKYSSGAFSQSITHQHPGILQYLCEKFPKNKNFTAEAALNVRSTAIFQVLFDHGWTADVQSSRFKPPIPGNMAQSEEMTQWFLKHGSNPNSRCDWDITPLSAAIYKASLSTIRLMLQHGGDTRNGQLLHFAMERKSPDQLAIFDMLISFGAPLDARMFEDDPGSWLENKYFGMGTPLHKAVDRGNTDAVAHLLWRGAEREVLDSVGRTALDVAREKENHEIVEMIESSMTRNHSP